MKLTCDLSLTSAPHRPGASAAPWYTPWLSPTSAVIPGLVLDFNVGTYGVAGMIGTLASTMTFSRASQAIRTDQTGALEVLGPDIARIDYDPISLAQTGLMLENTATNLFLQTDAPASQSIAVAAVPHVLSFYGTGTITLSGAHTATVVGTGPYPGRTVYSFTPTAGSLTVTLSGVVQSPQLEEGPAASSFIPTSASAAARSDDIASVPLGGWFDTNAGTLVFDGVLNHALANDRIVELDNGATSTRLSVLWNTVLNKPQFQVWDSGVLQAAIAPGGAAIGFGGNFRVALAYSADDFAVSMNGSAAVTDTLGLVPTGLTTLRLGRSVWGAQGLLLAKSVTYYPGRLPDAELQLLST